MNRRSNVRIPLIARGMTAALVSAECGVVYTANVSRGGLCFFSRKSLPLNTELLLELQVQGPDHCSAMEHLRGNVIWKQEWEDLTVHGTRLTTPVSREKTPALDRLLAACPAAEAAEAAEEAEGAAMPETDGSSGRLTERERDIIRLIGQGYINREIARRLSISVKTVETHRSNIYAKLKVHNAVQLLRKLKRSGNWLVNQDQPKGGGNQPKDF